jgi:propionyl-CoA carboxylase beta chain
MSSKYLGPMLRTRAHSEIAVMALSAASVLHTRRIQNAENPDAEREKVIQEYKEKYLNPYAAANAGFCDEIILPSETRMKIISALEIIKDKQVQNPARKHGNPPV